MPKKKLKKAERDQLFNSNKTNLVKLFKRNPCLVGLDIGTDITGLCIKGKPYSIFGGNGLRVKRIHAIRNQLFKKFKKLKLNSEPVVVLVEDYSLSLKGASLYQLAEAGGVINDLFFKLGVLVFRVAPSTLKKFVLGPGKRSKAQNKKQVIMVEVLDRWGIKITDDNACDAYCLYKFASSLSDFILDKSSLKAWEQPMFRDFVINRGHYDKME